MKPYYYTFNRHNGIPTVKHDSLEIAQGEAERLAAKQPGQAFEILRCVGISQTSKASTFWMDGEEPPGEDITESRYRMLEFGEVFQSGDEYEVHGEWRLVPHTSFGLELNGHFSIYPHRRPL